MKKFNIFVKKARRLIEEKKENKKLVDLLKDRQNHHFKIQELKLKIFSSNTSKNWSVCVEKMIELYQLLEDVLKPEFKLMDPNDHSYNAHHWLITEGEKKIHEQCLEIMEDYNELLKFAYELRRQDCEYNQITKAEGNKLDRFTRAFLKDYLKSEELYNIILSNEWSLNDQEMRRRPGYSFMVTYGPDG